jgi:hypothetical protein
MVQKSAVSAKVKRKVGALDLALGPSMVITQHFFYLTRHFFVTDVQLFYPNQ